MSLAGIGQRVVRVHAIGGPEVLRIDQLPVEPPGPAEVGIAVDAIGLNRADVMFRRNTYIEKPVLPSRLGFEAVGRITALGPGVTGFRIGQRVAVVPGAPLGAHGTCADWVNVPVARVLPCPEGLSDIQTAALWMSYGTPYGALIEVCGLSAGQRVLITAANTTVGLAAIQIARAVGAIPIGTVLTENLREPVQQAGAEAVIVMESANLAQGLRQSAPDGIDAAFDAVGGPQVADIAGAMRPGGTIVIHGALSNEPTPFPLKLALRKNLCLRGYYYTTVTDDPAALSRAQAFLEEGIAAGIIAPRIDRCFALADIDRAHAYLESGQQFGKIVVLTRPDG
ncbi:MAG TPA: zinc-dependent alcohol dehydrogenase family protein [Paracoccus sp. (in: a-proteobacteria)]|uniref:zinc-dependent alcohol dehydrogenase family protein n=1 Tax=Paracoccus sp. TaxID=267 RepID=UPI002BA7D4B8|nr:zinc-dependent alcohol dehydrogenase family protein [Paracoccus sp. (in: a-proteobacteria)]HWL56596.1 zinc-dependent alcohol dehydrogenase family protein [Paracoccus sp. (in: a-proteobacteria)]